MKKGWIILIIIIAVIIVAAIAYRTYTFSTIFGKDGEKYCQIDEDCIPFSNCCFNGCYNKDKLPSDCNIQCIAGPHPAPENCFCINNLCEGV